MIAHNDRIMDSPANTWNTKTIVVRVNGARIVRYTSSTTQITIYADTGAVLTETLPISSLVGNSGIDWSRVNLSDEETEKLRLRQIHRAECLAFVKFDRSLGWYVV